jgi:hypothetical protein
VGGRSRRPTHPRGTSPEAERKPPGGAHAHCHRRVKYTSKYIYQKGENKVKQ